MQDNGDGYTMSYDEDLVLALNDRIGSLHDQRDMLVDQVATLDQAIKRYEKARKALEVEPPINTAKARSQDNRLRAMQSLARSDAWPALRESIILYARDHDEFTQAEFRETHDMTSSKCSTAFGLLHEEKVLRISRVQGNHKFFRLTKAHEDAQA